MYLGLGVIGYGVFQGLMILLGAEGDGEELSVL